MILFNIIQVQVIKKSHNCRKHPTRTASWSFYFIHNDIYAQDALCTFFWFDISTHAEIQVDYKSPFWTFLLSFRNGLNCIHFITRFSIRLIRGVTGGHWLIGIRKVRTSMNISKLFTLAALHFESNKLRENLYLGRCDV